MLSVIREPWPWYVAGPLFGLAVALVLVLGNRSFGMSASLRHMCAIAVPGRAEYFRYDVKRAGAWNLAMVAGFLAGGFVAANWLGGGGSVAISAATTADLVSLGVRDFSGIVPDDIFSWESLLTLRGAVVIVVGGFLVGFGAAWAGGCTSGHGITGLATFQLPSLIAVAAFFAGGIAATYLLLPLLFGGGAS
ncbi:MAG TPA: YeeE/YedE thiosulfate transporter family protein [Gemmatimonadaceae bacterium]|nr:YeeE/YedE thiosulfate transporter family protein [Gemmatimonadaceae bacterium]